MKYAKCSVCGQILDLSETTCQNCGADITKNFPIVDASEQSSYKESETIVVDDDTGNLISRLKNKLKKDTKT